MRRRRYHALLALLLICLSVIPAAAVGDDSSEEALNAQKLTEAFIRTHMLTDGGVRTNFREDIPVPEHATGRDVLSESQGLLMLYALAVGDEPLFDSAASYVRLELLRDGLISYRNSEDFGLFPINAAIDDLRIIRALLDAASVFDRPDYLVQALGHSLQLYQTNVQGTSLRDFYEARQQLQSESLTLCFADFLTMRRLGEYDSRWLAVYADALAIVRNGFISDSFPLFYASYHYRSGTYTDAPITTVQALITAIHLSEVGQCPPETVRLIKAKVLANELYGQYRPDGEPVGNVQSTAVYALAAILGMVAGDEELYREALERVRWFQVRDESSPLHGAYANTVTQDAYSFDNLCALLAHGLRSD